MAATTLSAIRDRFAAVLEAAPLNLTKTTDAFSHDRQPNTVLDNAYRVEDAGMVQNRPVGNTQFARVDRLRIYIARKLAFDPAGAIDSVEDTLNTIERYILADDAAHDYHASVEGRGTPNRPQDADIVVGSLTLLVDYDYDARTA